MCKKIFSTEKITDELRKEKKSLGNLNKCAKHAKRARSINGKPIVTQKSAYTYLILGAV
jgi:hypothetical protein